MKYIRKFNSEKLPGAIYIPIDLIGKSLNISQTVLRICEEYALCLSSKERVPFHILIEVIETKTPVSNSKLSFSPFGISNLLNTHQEENIKKEYHIIHKISDEKIIEISINKDITSKKSHGFFSNIMCCCKSSYEVNFIKY